MNELKLVNNTSLSIKEYNGQRVVTFKDVDVSHERKDGTANYNFRNNKKKFIEGIDYYKVPKNELGGNFPVNSKMGNPTIPVTLITHSGYMMLVKSFTDDLSWKIQRQLVDNYFNPQPQTTVTTTSKLPVELQMFAALFDNATKQESRLSALEEKVSSLQLKAYSPVKAEKPPAVIVDGMFSRPISYTATNIAKAFDLNARQLNRFLYSKGIICPEGDGWKINGKLESKNYAYNTRRKRIRNGELIETVLIWWTTQGKDHICALLKEEGLINQGKIKHYVHNKSRKRKK